MPAYFSVTFQYRVESAFSTLVRELYAAILENGFSFKSGYFSDRQNITIEEIADWNQSLVGIADPNHQNGTRVEDFKQVVFHSECFSEVRGFWMQTGKYLEFIFIIPEDDVLSEEGSGIFRKSKIEMIIRSVCSIWEHSHVECVQVGLEFDEAGYYLDEIKTKKEVLCNPFAIVNDEYFAFIDEGFRSKCQVTKLHRSGNLIVNSESFN